MIDYAVEGEIGRGVVGPIRAARYLPTGFEVAVEEIPSELSSDAAFTQRLAVTGKAAAAFRHPAAIAVLDLVDDDGRLLLVTEPVDGIPLGELAARRTPMAPTSALMVADQVLAALHAAHAEGVVHGGVSSGGILITPHGEVRLGGFGLAAALHPEITPDPAADLVATARLTAGLLGLALDEPGGGPADLRAVRNVLRRAAASDPRHRYRSASGMRQALRAAARRSLGEDWETGAALDRLVGEAVASGRTQHASEAGAASTSPRRRAGRRARRLAIALVAIAAGAVAGLAISAARAAPAPFGGALTVTGPVSVRLSPAAGSCGTSFTARASAPVRGAGDLVYRWERSDGGATANRSLRVSSADASFSVSQSWLLQGPAPYPSLTFEVVSPEAVNAPVSIAYACP